MDELWARAEDGCHLLVRAPAPLLAELGAWWPPTGLVRCDDPPEGRAHVVVRAVADDAGASIRLESDVSLFTAEHLLDRVAVHAALVAWEGGALLLPGASHAGKSTLCLALASAGATVLSDEYALVDPSAGTVTGWARPVRRRLADGTVRRLAIAEPTDEPVSVRLVADLRYAPDVPARATWITTADAATAILRNTVCAQRRPGDALSAALAVARGARALGGVRHDAAPAAAALLGLASASGRAGPGAANRPIDLISPHTNPKDLS